MDIATSIYGYYVTIPDGVQLDEIGTAHTLQAYYLLTSTQNQVNMMLGSIVTEGVASV
jgi:hypothetical protein